MERYITARHRAYIKRELSDPPPRYAAEGKPTCVEMSQPFEILEVEAREYSRHNTRGTQWKVRLNPTPEIPLPDPVSHFVDSVNNLFEHVLEDVGDADMVGITIHNEVNQSDKPIGFSFIRKDQLSSDVIWSVFDKLSQSNARFNTSDTLIVTVHSVTMP